MAHGTPALLFKLRMSTYERAGDKPLEYVLRPRSRATIAQ
jgi:hypothetical protein